ncbi:hypothetical protein [Vibrio breoganii]|uniref:hypothetical protein n=1 Tax=Vibrio breoganii TaxID=553239 RepID=UPI000C8277DD|nr:hypothetical protein [Vibrio breoganii]PMG94747.1 hypothetical protein BCU80_06120 [Vibrio breoganii]
MRHLFELELIERDVAESGCDKIKVSGLTVYPLIRRSLKNGYCIKKGYFSNTNNRNYGASDIFLIVKSVFVSLYSFRFIFLNKKVSNLFLGFSRRSVGSDGKNFDKFHDPIIESLDYKDSIMIERPFKFAHYKNRSTKCDVVEYDFVIYISIFISVLLLPFILLRNVKMINYCKKRFNELFRGKYLSSYGIGWLLTRTKVESAIAKWIMKKLSVDNLIVTSRWLHYPFIAASKELGINSFEIQHGSILRKNTFYSEFSEEEFKVGNMLVFSDYWKNRDWNTDRVISLGTTSIHRNVNSFVNLGSIINKKTKNVLVISQPELQRNLIEDLIDLSSINKHVNFVLKLHPQDIDDYKSRYSKLECINNIEIVSDNSFTLAQIYPDVDLVLGYNSTALFEAYDFGCSVGVICTDKMQFDDYRAVYDYALNFFHKVKTEDPLCDNYFKPIDYKVNLFFQELDKNLIKELFNEKVI